MIIQTIQQGRPCSFVSNFVHINHRLEPSPTNQKALIDISSLIGRYLQEQLDDDWSTVTYLVASLVRKVNVKKRKYKEKKDDLVEDDIQPFLSSSLSGPVPVLSNLAWL